VEDVINIPKDASSINGIHNGEVNRTRLISIILLANRYALPLKRRFCGSKFLIHSSLYGVVVFVKLMETIRYLTS
jgi:hypothetical protein